MENNELLALLLQLNEFGLFESTLPALAAVVDGDGKVARALGELFHRFGFTELAIEHLVRAAQLGEADKQLYITLATLCHRKGLLDEAEAFALEALKSSAMNGDASVAYMALGAIYLAQGRFADAELVLSAATTTR